MFATASQTVKKGVSLKVDKISEDRLEHVPEEYDNFGYVTMTT